MSNRGAGRGSANQNYKHKAGNKPGYNDKRNTFQNDRRSTHDNARQASSPEGHEASSGQPSGSDNRRFGSGKRNSFDTQQLDQKSNFSSGGNKPQARTFSMSPNSNPSAEYDPKVTSSDDYKQRVKSKVCLLQRAHGVENKVDPNTTHSNNSSTSSSAPILHSVETESGPFECSDNLSQPNESSQSGSNNPKESNSKKEASCITEAEGDLFSAPGNVSLAHCVGADLRMGSGIAVRFREQFKSIGKLFDQRVGPGGVATIFTGQRHIFYLITKQASKEKPSIDTMRQCLVTLKEKCKQLNVTQLAMPQIGCGLDGLLWEDVKEMLEEIFADGFAITIYKLEKDAVETRRSGLKSRVVNHNLMLKDIDSETGLLYIGCEDGFVSEEMKSINEKHPFLSGVKSPHKPSSVVKIHAHQSDMVYGLICKKNAHSRLSYEQLEAAINHLWHINKKDNYKYFGLQAFVEEDDPYVMEKIDTLFRNSFINAEFWICWPPNLEHMSPSNSKESDEGMQVQKGRYPSTENRQSSSRHSSSSAEKSKGWNSKDSSKVWSKEDNSRRNFRNQEQAVREVEEKMDAQSLSDKSKSGATYSEAKNDALNTSDMAWDDEDKQLAELPDFVDSSHNTDNDEWFQEDKYAEDERRKTSEKQEAKKLSKIKDREEKRSIKTSCVTECRGDLFETEDTMSLAHCVGADLRMAAGIAVLFRQTFNSLPELCDQRVKQGGVAYIQHGKRYVFYLVTKTESTGKPTYDTLRSSLIELRKKCNELNVTELAMPRIGCGLDRLQWSNVKQMLEEIFTDVVSIKIYNLEKPMYSPNTSDNGRTPLGEGDNKRMAALLRDCQRTMEATYRKLTSVNDLNEEIHGPDGLKKKTHRNTIQINESDEKLNGLCSEIAGITLNYQSLCERFENMQREFEMQKTENQGLKLQVKFLEQQLRQQQQQQQQQLDPRSVAQGYCLDMNGTYSSSGIPDGPLPFIPESGGPQVWPSPAAYYGGSVHSGYHPHPQFYAIDQVSAEREALNRAAQLSATENGYEIRHDEDGIIYMRKKNQPHEQFRPIRSYGDLRFLDNPQA